MIETIPNRCEIERRERRRTPFFQLGNEILDVFQPIMGRECLAVYCQLVRRAFKDPELKHSVLELSTATGMGTATVSRSLEVLEHLVLIQLIRCGGSQKSQCRLLDSEEAAERLGATYHKISLRWSLAKETKQSLRTEIKRIRQRQQGKCTESARDSLQSQTVSVRHVSQTCLTDTSAVAERNAGIPLEKCQRVARETQIGALLIEEERRNEEGPSPTPSHIFEADKTKSGPDEEELRPMLKWARVKFTGLMKDLGDYLFDSSRPPVPHLANGAADWKEFGFDSLALEAAQPSGKGLVITLSASDPTAARRGLEKYREKWEASCRRWYECEVFVELKGASRN